MGRGPDRNNETADVLYINIGIGLHQSCSCLKPLYAYLRRISNRMQRRKTQLLYSDTSYSDTSGMIVFTLIAELKHYHSLCHSLSITAELFTAKIMASSPQKSLGSTSKRHVTFPVSSCPDHDDLPMIFVQ